MTEARKTIREWELRHGHRTFIACLDGGEKGYQAQCSDCGWKGSEFLRGDEEIGTPASRAHKINARRQMFQHRADTTTRHA